MLRKLLLPLAAAGLLGGCATGDYAYRGGTGGDYYYGRPQVEYRYHGSPYGYSPYGYSPYGSYSRFGLYGVYGHPYYGHPFYGHSYYGHPYYGYPYSRPRPPIIVQPRPDDGTVREDREDRPPPWRDLTNRRRSMTPDVGDAMRPPAVPTRPMTQRPMPQARRDGGSRMEQIMRRGREGAPREREE
jgi:hypothetical protein